MNLTRDILDQQVVDRNGQRLGKVDGVILELREGQPPRIAAIEIGPVTLARRMHPRLAARLERLLEWVAPVAEEIGAAPYLAIPERNAAERQIARFEEGATLEEIYAEQVRAGESIVV